MSSENLVTIVIAQSWDGKYPFNIVVGQLQMGD